MNAFHVALLPCLYTRQSWISSPHGLENKAAQDVHVCLTLSRAILKFLCIDAHMKNSRVENLEGRGQGDGAKERCLGTNQSLDKCEIPEETCCLI